MKTKRQILPLLIVLVFSALGQAQSSAQATMNVSVQVVSGISATCTTAEVPLTEAGFKGELGTVLFTGAEKGQVLITNDSKVTLVNEEGHKVEIPVEMNSESNPGKPQLKFSASGGTPSQSYEGSYHGTLSTTIEYL